MFKIKEKVVSRFKPYIGLKFSIDFWGWCMEKQTRTRSPTMRLERKICTEEGWDCQMWAVGINQLKRLNIEKGG